MARYPTQPTIRDRDLRPDDIERQYQRALADLRKTGCFRLDEEIWARKSAPSYGLLTDVGRQTPKR